MMAEITTFSPPIKEAPTDKLTYEEFLAWCDEDTWAEWVDGEVQMVSPASNVHQDVARFLIAILSVYVEAHDLGVIRPAPFQMRLATPPRSREPDILFIAKEHLPRLKNTYLDGPADLVIEILSPESLVRDRGDKFIEYEAGGVTEYWLVDPERKQADFYHLGADRRYHSMSLGPDNLFRSEVLGGFPMRVAWLWQEPLPKVADVLRELRLV